MRVPERAWVAEPRYQALLYFCQLVDDMVWESTRDSHRAPAMNTYHLCVEARRTSSFLPPWPIKSRLTTAGTCTPSGMEITGWA